MKKRKKLVIWRGIWLAITLFFYVWVLLIIVDSLALSGQPTTVELFSASFEQFMLGLLTFLVGLISMCCFIYCNIQIERL